MNSTTLVCASCLLCILILQVLCEDESSGSGITDVSVNNLPPSDKRQPGSSHMGQRMCKLHAANCRNLWPGMRPSPGKKASNSVLRKIMEAWEKRVWNANQKNQKAQEKEAMRQSSFRDWQGPKYDTDYVQEELPLSSTKDLNAFISPDS